MSASMSASANMLRICDMGRQNKKLKHNTEELKKSSTLSLFKIDDISTIKLVRKLKLYHRKNKNHTL